MGATWIRDWLPFPVARWLTSAIHRLLVCRAWAIAPRVRARHSPERARPFSTRLEGGNRLRVRGTHPRVTFDRSAVSLSCKPHITLTPIGVKHAGHSHCFEQNSCRHRWICTVVPDLPCQETTEIHACNFPSYSVCAGHRLKKFFKVTGIVSRLLTVRVLRF